MACLPSLSANRRKLLVAAIWRGRAAGRLGADAVPLAPREAVFDAWQRVGLDGVVTVAVPLLALPFLVVEPLPVAIGLPTRAGHGQHAGLGHGPALAPPAAGR